VCDKTSELLTLLDGVFGILKLGWGKVCAEDGDKAREYLKTALKLWKELSLSHTPKWHCLLEHAIDQMVACGGFGDMLEDFVELYHQLGNRDEIRLAGLKSEPQKAASMAAWESVHNSKQVKAAKEVIGQVG